MKTVRIALCQINPSVGDLEGNVKKIAGFIEKAGEYYPDIIAFPELAVTGYPPEDLLLKPQFIKDTHAALKEIQACTGDAVVITGFVDRRDDIYNAAAVLYNGQLIDVYQKMHLPNYSVFDEFRYFQAGSRYTVYEMEDFLFGVTICEDIWYEAGPSTVQALAGAEFIININASPYNIGKAGFRKKMVATRAYDNSVIIAYLNTVGGQDELVFDGQSFIVDQDGEIIAEGKQFEEDMIIADLDLDAVFIKRLHDPRRRQQVFAMKRETAEKIPVIPKTARAEVRGHDTDAQRHGLALFPRASASPHRCVPPAEEEEVFGALVLGTRDYVHKNRFVNVCIGLSGGIDSAIVAAIAVDAVGAHNVTGVFMPSLYTSQESREDTQELVRNLGIKLIEIPITSIFEAYTGTLAQSFEKKPADITEENLQARIRGNLLMALSNKFGWLVLTTGNKSEMSVGYATLYGDMAGGFAVIKDVPKTLVYRLCRWKNLKEGRMVIPGRVLAKPPTAELRPDQKDTDTLPPYEVLDPILKLYIEEDKSFDEITALNPDCGVENIKKIIRMVDFSEYKRRQSPPGIKITPRAFGRDRRFPITNRYRNW
ncbi:MAG TPA: NAD+ synthase [Dissulfurispiraceae bacterium]|nr:NAD+ synthase [Dissulfurispiraceae bacterium]